MKVIVLKFGGSSLSTPENIQAVARQVVDRKRAGFAVSVVVSAMGDTTDSLLDLARSVARSLPPRELDVLLTTGEQVSMALLSMAIAEIGEEAVSLTGPQAGIITCQAHNRARIIEVRPHRVQAELCRGRIVVVAGFQGLSYSGEITTLGRGGSDTSAVALAAALDAERCEINSDVDGVYSTDPRLFPEASRLTGVSYDEMLEMARCGARVLNADAVELARRNGLELWARATFGDGPGTVICARPIDPGRVVAVAGRENLLWVRFRHPDLQSSLENLLGESEIFCRGAGELLVSSENSGDSGLLKQRLTETFPHGLACSTGATTISLIGGALSSATEVSTRAGSALAQRGLPPLANFTGPMSVTYLIPAGWLAQAVTILHNMFLAQEVTA